VAISSLPPGRYQHSHVGDGRIGKVVEVDAEQGLPLKLELPARSVLTVTADPPPPGPTPE